MSLGAEFKEQGKPRRRNAFYAPVALILLFCVVLLVISLVFRVRKIEVINASEYTDSQLIEASGLQTGTSLLFVDRFSAASLIFTGLPYMEAVSVQTELPDKVIIQASGTAASAYMSVEGELWLVDRKGIMLEPVGEAGTAGFTELRGITASSPFEGEMLLLDEENTARMNAATALLSALLGADELKHVEWIDLTKANDPHLRYDGRFTVSMGEVTDALYQVALLKDVFGKLSPEDTGALTYTGGGAWTYSPD